jgi:peptidoglycan hydrolase-like protein with peptidoglycan-binding domain
LALDVEGPRRGLTAAQWLGWIVRAKRVIEETLSVPPLIYSSRAYWIDPEGLNNLPAPELADCLGWWKFWSAPPRTMATYDPATVDLLPPPPAPPPWQTSFGIHQYAGDALRYPGFKSTVDLNRLHVQRQEDTGESVKWIQRRLPGLVVDGTFGPKTDAAIRAFQIRKKITADGVVGLETLQLLTWESVHS